MKKLLGALWLSFATQVIAAPLHDLQFKNPAFNGSDYSSHVLTIENQAAPQSLWDKLVETSYAR